MYHCLAITSVAWRICDCDVSNTATMPRMTRHGACALLPFLLAARAQEPLRRQPRLDLDESWQKGPQHYNFGETEKVSGGRALQVADTWAPVRISIREAETSQLSTVERQFLLSDLLPAAVRWLRSALRVRPVAGAFYAARVRCQPLPLNPLV